MNYTITGVEQVRQNDRDVRKSREKYYKKLFDVQIKWNKSQFFTLLNVKDFVHYWMLIFHFLFLVYEKNW